MGISTALTPNSCIYCERGTRSKTRRPVELLKLRHLSAYIAFWHCPDWFRVNLSLSLSRNWCTHTAGGNTTYIETDGRNSTACIKSASASVGMYSTHTIDCLNVFMSAAATSGYVYARGAALFSKSLRWERLQCTWMARISATYGLLTITVVRFQQMSLSLSRVHAHVIPQEGKKSRSYLTYHRVSIFTCSTEGYRLSKL